MLQQMAIVSINIAEFKYYLDTLKAPYLKINYYILVPSR